MNIIKIFLICFLSFSLNATEVAQNMPPLEESFVKLVNKALDEHIATTNGVKKTKIELDLQKSSSVLLKDGMLKDWVGKVVSISLGDSDGSAKIAVSLSFRTRQVMVLAYSENKTTDDKLHIHTGIDLYKTISELEVGDKVVFSGRFFSLSPDTIMVNIFESGDMFFGFGIFQFTSIKKIESVKKSK